MPIGLIGHSVRRPDRRADSLRAASFLVSMAGPGLGVGEAFADRECNGLEKSTSDAMLIERHRAFTLALYQDLRERGDARSIPLKSRPSQIDSVRARRRS